MSKIISMSMNNEMLENIDNLQKSMGFSGRSEVIRSAVRHMMSEQKQLSDLGSEVEGIMIVIHDDESSDDVSKIRHMFQSIIKTQLHNHLKNHKCLDVFVISGDSKTVKQAFMKFRNSKKIDIVKLVLA